MFRSSKGKMTKPSGRTLLFWGGMKGGGRGGSTVVGYSGWFSVQRMGGLMMAVEVNGQ